MFWAASMTEMKQGVAMTSTDHIATVLSVGIPYPL